MEGVLLFIYFVWLSPKIPFDISVQAEGKAPLFAQLPAHPATEHEPLGMEDMGTAT